MAFLMYVSGATGNVKAAALLPKVASAAYDVANAVATTPTRSSRSSISE